MIKKLFVNQNEGYIIVLRDDVVKEYKNLSNDDFIKVYSTLIHELKNSNSEYSNIADGRELVKTIYADGLMKMLDENDDLISEVIYDDKENKTTVNYYSGKSETFEEYDTESDIYLEKINLVCEQYDITAEELEKLGIIKAKKENKLTEVVKNVKVKNLITRKRLVSLAVAAALVATGFGISELRKKNNSNAEEKDSAIENTITSNQEPTAEEIASVEVSELPNPTETPMPVQIEVPTVVSTPIPTEVPTEAPTVAPTAVPTEIPNMQPDIQFTDQGFILEGGQIAVEIYPGSYAIRSFEEENYENYETLELHSYENMSDIANCIQNPSGYPELTTVGKMIYYEKFYNDLNDYGLIKYFNNYRNEIIWQAFNEKNMEAARFYIKEANKELVRVIYDGNLVQTEVNGEVRNIYFSNLTPNAQTALKNIAWSMFDPFINDTFEYNGEIYDQSKVAERVFGIEVEKSK